MRDSVLDCSEERSPSKGGKPLRASIQRLLNLWEDDWQRADYVQNVLPRLLARPEEATDAERRSIDRLKQSLSCPSDVARIEALVRQEQIRGKAAAKAQDAVLEALRLFQMKRADEVFEEHRNLIEQDTYLNARANRIEKRKRTILKILSECDLETAQELATASASILRPDEQDAMRRWFRRRRGAIVDAHIRNSVLPLIRVGDMRGATDAFAVVARFAGSTTISQLQERVLDEMRAKLERIEAQKEVNRAAQSENDRRRLRTAGSVRRKRSSTFACDPSANTPSAGIRFCPFCHATVQSYEDYRGGRKTIRCSKCHYPIG